MEENITEKKGLSRREFAKAAMGFGFGLTAFGGSVTSPGAIAMAEESEKQNQSLRAKLATTVENPIIFDKKTFKKFSSTNLAFNVVSREMDMVFWGQYMKNFMKNLEQGKGAKDIKIGTFNDVRAINALEAASQVGNRLTGKHGEGNENQGLLKWDNHINSANLGSMPISETDPDILTNQVKIASRLCGADLVGICKLDRRFVYESTQQNVYHPETPVIKNIVFKDVEKPSETDTELIIPDRVQNAIVFAVEMPRELVQSSPGPAAGIADGIGYSRMGFVSLSVAEFIRNLGYTAIPCKNDTALSVPLAIAAGLGEGGRLGTLITPEYGPCVRLCKVLTDMPLNHDKPIKFGVEEFCNHCKKCARECPSKCITEGEQSFEARNECSQPGVLKWQNDYKKCLGFWVENGMSCSNCVSVCPFTKGAMWAHKLTEWSIEHIPAADPIWLTLDDSFGYGKRRKDMDVWKRKNTTTFGLDPAKM